MNKEVGFVVNGFLLLAAVLTAVGIGQFLISIPVRTTEEKTEIAASSHTAAPAVTNKPGQTLFYNNCATCHALTKDLTGPGLSGVTQRITDKKRLYNWIRNPAAVLQSGDPYFNNLKKAYNNVVMNGFPELSDDEIDAILDYVSP